MGGGGGDIAAVWGDAIGGWVGLPRGHIRPSIAVVRSLRILYARLTAVVRLVCVLSVSAQIADRDFVRRSGGHLVVHGDQRSRGVELLNGLFGYSVVGLGACGVSVATTGRFARSGAILDQYGSAGTPFAQVCAC